MPDNRARRAPRVRLVIELYFQGRGSPAWLATIWTVAFVASVLFWNVGMEIPGSENSATLTARLSIPFAASVASAWTMSPLMASWEVLSVPRVRRLSGAAVAIFVCLAVSALAFTVSWVTWAPASVVPGYFSGAEDLRFAFRPLVWNLFVLVGLAWAAVALFGRAIGTIIAIVGYLTLVVAGADLDFYHVVPYYSQAFGIPVTEHPIAAVAMSATAVGLWMKSGGATRSARKLDPR